MRTRRQPICNSSSEFCPLFPRGPSRRNWRFSRRLAAAVSARPFARRKLPRTFEMARELTGKSRPDCASKSAGTIYELTLLATDRPFLFAGVSGTLAAWGMNIWKAEAFANAAGVVVDTFHFTDPHNTLELNPSEPARLQKNIADVLSGAVPLETLMRGRDAAHSNSPAESQRADADSLRRRQLFAFHADGDHHAGPAGPAFPLELRAGQFRLQYRSGADRYRRAARAGYFLPHFWRSEAHARHAGTLAHAPAGGRVGRERGTQPPRGTSPHILYIYRGCSSDHPIMRRGVILRVGHGRTDRFRFQAC